MSSVRRFNFIAVTLLAYAGCAGQPPTPAEETTPEPQLAPMTPPAPMDPAPPAVSPTPTTPTTTLTPPTTPTTPMTTPSVPPATPPVPPGTPAAPSALDEARRIILEVEAAPDLTAETLEKILGGKLTSASQSGSWATSEASPAQGPFARVELRRPDAGPRRLVILEVRPGVELAYPDFRGNLIPTANGPTFNPSIPPEGTMSFAVQQPGHETRYQFGAMKQLLQLVAFERK